MSNASLRSTRSVGAAGSWEAPPRALAPDAFMTTGYPAILVLEGRLAVVIGGGGVGERKVRTLRDAGAKVRVVSEEVTEKVRALADAGEIEWVQRRYERGDLAGASVVVAATD